MQRARRNRLALLAELDENPVIAFSGEVEAGSGARSAKVVTGFASERAPLLNVARFPGG